MPLAYRTAPGTPPQPDTAVQPEYWHVERKRLRRATLLLFALFCATGLLAQTDRVHPKVPQGGELTVFAAADMQPVFEVLGPYFERRTGIRLKFTFGSSATLSEQIINGAPADIFFSADYVFAERVVAANLTDTRDPTAYAKGLLVLWARNDSRFKPLNLDDLARHDLRSVAIANPDHAPYGRAAVAAMKKLKYYDNVVPHLVQGESIGQAAQFALSGNAELALISQTIALSPKYKSAGTSVLFPLEVYQNIRQCAVVIKNSAHRGEGHILLNYMTSDEIQLHLPELGLQRVQ